MVAPNGQSGPAEAAEREPSSTFDEFAVPGLPRLTIAGKRFLSAYLRSNCNLEAACKAADLPLEHANLYTTDPSIREHLKADFEFAHWSLKRKAARARDLLLDHLVALLPEVTDPREKRLLLQQLHRATAASIVPAGTSRSSSGTPDNPPAASPRFEAQSQVEEDPQSEIQIPRSGAPQSAIQNPKSEIAPPIILTTDQPAQIAPKIVAALKAPDQPWPQTDLTILADVIEFDAEVNDDLVGSEDEQEIVDALAETSLISLRGHSAAHHLESLSHSDRKATEIWSIETRAGPIKVTFDFERSLESDDDSLSRFPGRWMIKKITTAPSGDG